MAQIVDNLIAYRVLSMLVKPFDQTDAFKLGIIDAEGNNVVKSKDFTTTAQKDAYTYLHRLVFNIKKLLNKLPGGESKLKNLVAAFFLVKEAYTNKQTTIDPKQLQEVIALIDRGVVLVEEQMYVEDFLLAEDAPANATGSAVSTDAPVIRRRPRQFAKFVVGDEVYNKFANGKAKYRKWASYLNLENEGERMIYDFARTNPRGVIILQNGSSIKSIRFNRRGGGNWHKIKRRV